MIDGQTPDAPGPADKIRPRRSRQATGAGTSATPRWRWWLLSLWTLAVAGIAVVCHLPGDRAVLAVPLELKGGVLGSWPGHDGKSALRLHQPLPAGCRIVVPAGGSAVVSLLPGLTIQVEDQTEFFLDELTIRKSEMIVESRQARITLSAGRMRCSVVRPEDQQAELQVSTPTGVIHAGPGSLFSVAAGAGSVRVVCGWGMLLWWNADHRGGTTVLLAGEFCDRKILPAAMSLARKVLDDPETQQETAELLQTGTLMDALQDAHRAEPPPFLRPAHLPH